MSPRIERKTKIEDGRLIVQTLTDKTPALEAARRIRNARLMRIGQRIIGPDEHADVAVAFQFPTVLDHQQAKEDFPDIFAALESGDEVAAIRAAEQLAILRPEYVVSVRDRGRVAVTEPAKPTPQPEVQDAR